MIHTPSRLDEIEAIKQLKYRYFRLVDTANWAELAECFVESATVRYVGGSYRVERSGRHAILEYLAGAIHSQCISVHQGGHPEIRLSSPTTATGRWYQNDWFLDLRSNTKLSGACVYDDRYVKEGGDWKIEHTGYERLYEIVEQLRRHRSSRRTISEVTRDHRKPDADRPELEVPRAVAAALSRVFRRRRSRAAWDPCTAGADARSSSADR